MTQRRVKLVAPTGVKVVVRGQAPEPPRATARPAGPDRVQTAVLAVAGAVAGAFCAVLAVVALALAGGGTGCHASGAPSDLLYLLGMVLGGGLGLGAGLLVDAAAQSAQRARR